MDREAIAKFVDAAASDTSWRDNYVTFIDSDDITLDGHFTAAQIIAMAEILKEHCK